MNVNAKKILLVEDEVIIGLAEREELQSYGYSVSLVHTGEAAVFKALEDADPPDLILMDINLGPGIDGTEAAEQILTVKDIPIVFLSSHIEKEVVEKTERITSYGYVVKNSGIVVLDASIKMAFKLFASKLAEKEKEISLKKSEKLLGLTQSLAKIGGWIQDLEYGTMEWTDALYEIHDIKKSEVSSLQEKLDLSINCYDEKSRQCILEAYDECVKTGKPYSMELPFTTPAGKKKWIWSVTQALVENNKPKQLYGYFMDITEKVHMEKDNRMVHAILEAEHNTSLDGILVVDIDGKVISFNEKFCQIFEVPEDLIQLKDDNLLLQNSMTKVVNPDAFFTKIRYLYDHKSETSRDEIYLKNGTCYDRYSSPILDNSGKYLGRIWFLHDITHMKQAEALAKNQTAEKEILLKEVNHRIKNNISSVETLLQTQADGIKDGPSVEILQDAISRVRSMRVIYDKLFMTESYTILSVSLYIGDLLSALFDIFPRSNTIQISTDLDDFDMGIKDLFALGLIVNELVTNSMKYAFPGDTRGRLSVSVKKSGETVLLQVIDSGRGIPDSMGREGFGLMLVSILTEQLNGVFSNVHTSEGFSSEVKFAADPVKQVPRN